MDQESLGISVGFTPSSYPDRMPRREERLDTRPATVSTPPILHPLQPLAPRDITSHSRPLPDTSACAFSQLAHHDRLQLTQQWVVWNRPPQGGSRGPTSIVRTAPGHEALPTSSSLPVRDTQIRKIICTTNAIESINARIRRAVNARGHFPTEAAALKCVYLAIMSLDPTGKGQQRWSNRWKAALNAFEITFDGRLSAART